MSAGSAACAQCHGALVPDQEWCHECGRSRTIVHRPPDWRIAVAIVIGVVALAAGATVFALTRISSNANQSAAAAVTPTPSRSVTPAAGTSAPGTSALGAPAGGASTGKLLSWPAGLGGWTVVLYASKSESTASATASSFQGTVPNLGLLNSSEHPSMNPGHWVVFAGRYPTKTEAQSAVASLLAEGHVGAHPRMVEPPGGN